ncbi:MAG: hypothetical protein RI580_09480 [Halothece sp. Uz-M2-17]|nr:hypothetical protein [Halothece sp. Uz-M2-17]
MRGFITDCSNTRSRSPHPFHKARSRPQKSITLLKQRSRYPL